MRLTVRAVGLWLLAAIALNVFAATGDSPDPVRLTIGVIPFNAPNIQSQQAEHTQKSLDDYFAAVEKDTANRKNGLPRVRITQAKGNYYQILQWMRDGQIDGAVVSPFTAFLLTHDPALDTYPVVEFVRAPRSSFSGAPAIVWGTTNGSRELEDPGEVLEECVNSAYASLTNPHPNQQCEFRLINHLSTTGFVLPLLYFKQFIQKKQMTADVERAFWKRILEWSRFEMWHGSPAEAAPPPRPGVPTLRFSYETPRRHGARLPLSVRLGSLNDVLILACRHGAEVQCGWPDAVARDAGGLWTGRSAALAAGHGRDWLGYTGTGVWSPEARESFASVVTSLFGARKPEELFSQMTPDTPLRQLFLAWYQERDYAFTIDEVADILAQDQMIRNAKNAALVLPGGGVRATYQSVILDALYESSIVNQGDPAAKPSLAMANRPGAQRLVIQSIAGTSGGALLGYLAARRDVQPSGALQNEWIRDGKVVTKPSAIFPWFGALRWLSVLLVIVVFAAMAAIHLQNVPARAATQVPVWYTALLSLIVCAAPFLIWRNSIRDPTYRMLWEGAAFFAVVFFVHFVHSVSANGAAPKPQLVRGGAAVVLLGLAAGTYLVMVYPFRESGWWAAMSALVTILVASGLTMIAGGRGTTIRQRLVREYGASMLVLFCLFGITFAFFAAGWLAGQVTTLEMTPAYWVWVFIAALMASTIVVTVGRLYPNGPLHKGIEFLAAPSGTAPFPYTPTVTLAGWGAVGVITWFVFIASAVYPSDVSRRTFDGIRARFRGPELAPLVVSMTGLGIDQKLKQRYTAFPRGDYYACRNCDAITKAQTVCANLFPIRRDDDFVGAVFASGSPFPIFPAVSVQTDDRNRGLFVDGGYAHRVPIEAARLAQASQILVIENVARRQIGDLAGHRVGALAFNLGNALGYLFDRSQELDVNAQKSAVVGTIYPDWTDADPFLMDFRDSVVLDLRQEARIDLDGHRVGRIVSWGVPDQRRIR